MSEPIIVRCSQCQQRMKVKPLATDSQVTCVSCGMVLRIRGTGATPIASAQPASNPAPQPATFRPQPTLAAQTPQPAPAFAAHSQRPMQPQMPSNPAAARPAKQGIPKWVLALIGVVLLVPIICCGVPPLFFTMRVNSGKPVPIAASLKAAVPPNPFPQLGTPEKTYPSGVKKFFFQVSANPNLPGHQMQMQVFLPAGEHDDRSLPCVVMAPAGTPLIHGASITANEEYDAETLPYAEAGFVVIHYSIDGGLPAGAEGADEESMMGLIGQAYPAFKASGAGVVNGRNAVEYATKLKMVDPQRISCAGHSSAGCLSLLLAAHEPRIHRCVAFAAAYDLESRMGDMMSNIMMRTLLPGILEFITETSPTTHVDKITCPTLIFHARNDSNVPFSDAEAFVAKMTASGKDVTFETTPTGDHYNSMIDPGIPTAIEWLKQ